MIPPEGMEDSHLTEGLVKGGVGVLGVSSVTPTDPTRPHPRPPRNPDPSEGSHKGGVRGWKLLDGRRNHRVQ